MRVYRDDAYATEVVVMVSRVKHGSLRYRVSGDQSQVSVVAPDRILLRVHDQCATSEVFGSLKCDCRQQLDASLVAMQAAASTAFSAGGDSCDGSRIVGVLVYLPQEGRGIGLAAKVAAYALQGELDKDTGSDSPSVLVQRGLDTVDANRALGLPDDSRHYGAVPRVLADLGLIVRSPHDLGAAGDSAGASAPVSVADSVSAAPTHASVGGSWIVAPGIFPLALLTNSPLKAKMIAALGVPLAARLPCLTFVSSSYASAYLRAKALRMGHDIPDRYFEWPQSQSTGSGVSPGSSTAEPVSAAFVTGARVL